MMEIRTIQRRTEPRFSDADLAALFVNWHDAVEAFQGMVKAGLDRSDQELATDGCYQRFLSSGLTLRKQAGAPAVRAAARFLCAKFHVPESLLKRLWAGLLDNDRQ